MDKIKPELNNINTWKSKFVGPYAIMDKLDGVSGLFIYTKSSSHLFTRGNGEYGQNISHLIKYLNIRGYEYHTTFKDKRTRIHESIDIKDCIHNVDFILVSAW